MENETVSTETAEGVDAEAIEAAGDAAGEAGHGADTFGNEVLEVAEITMPQLDIGIYPNLIFWLVLSLVAIYLILTRVALPRITTILAERNDAISNDIEQASIFKRRATEAEAAYNAALAKAREEAQTIAADAKAQIGRELAKLMAKADAEIAAKSAESESRIREIEASAVQSVSEVARSTAAAIVAAIGPRAAEPGVVERAVDDRMGG